MFTEPLLAILPATVQAKIRRLQANPDAATEALLARAARWLELHGALARHEQYGIAPAHVRPIPPPVRDHAAAVADVRQRIADVDAYTASLPAKVASGELLDVWANVFSTDAALSRLAWERIEEAIVTDAADAGISITRRPDLDPAALLEIERA